MSNLATMLSYVTIITANQLTQDQLTALLNMSDLEECESHPWARLKGEIAITSYPLTTFTNVQVTNGSQVVISTNTSFPPVTAQYVATVSGQPYATIPVIANPVASSQLMLVNPYPGSTSSTASLNLFPLYYSATDSFGTVFQQIMGVRQTTPLLRRTHEWINIVDPYRNSTASPAQFWAPAGRDVNDAGQFEMWPIETAANAYIVYGLKDHVDMVNPTDIPAVPSAVVMAKALRKACETLFSLKGDPRWSGLMTFYEGQYNNELQRILDSDQQQFGIQGRITDVTNSAEGTGQAFPGLDIIFNRDPVGY